MPRPESEHFRWFIGEVQPGQRATILVSRPDAAAQASVAKVAPAEATPTTS